MLPFWRRKRPVCCINILVHRGRREWLSAVDGVLQCRRSAGTVETGMAVPCHADTCIPWRTCRVWTWHARGRRANEGHYDECLSTHGRTTTRAAAFIMRCIACPSTPSLPQLVDSCSSQPYWLAVWLRGNALASINVVALRQTRLVPGWVIVYGRVNNLGM